MDFFNKNNEFSGYRISTKYPSKNDAACPVVNWGHGRLLPYESTLSFSFKFCKLNNISTKQLNILMYGLTGQYDWYNFELNDVQFKKISQLLDENISIIRTLKTSISNLPICYGTFSFVGNEGKSARVLRYCPICAKFGYISQFHECGWLAKCPLHLVDILEKKIGVILAGSIFDNQVKIVGELLGEFAPDWHFLMGREKIINDFSSPTFRKLTSWLSAAHKHRNALLNHNIWSLREQRYAADEVGVILDRLNWEVTIPNELKNILPTKVHDAEPKIVEYSTNQVANFTEILKNRNKSFFLSFYRTTVALGKEITSYRKLIDMEIEFLKTASTETPSSWGYSRYSGWERTNTDVWPHYCLQSIYEVAIDILFREWIFPWRDSDSSRKNDIIWFDYCRVAKSFLQQGLAVKLSNKDWIHDGVVCVIPYFRPIVKMSISDDVKEMLDDILCKEAQIHIEELRAWLFAVNNGISPWEAKFEGSSRANLFLSPHDARLVVWPR